MYVRKDKVKEFFQIYEFEGPAHFGIDFGLSLCIMMMINVVKMVIPDRHSICI